MKKIILLFFIITNQIYAQDKAIPLQLGQPAPFTGILLPPEMLASYIAHIERLEKELKTIKELYDEQIKLLENLYKKEVESYREDLLNCVKELDKPKIDVWQFMAGAGMGMVISFIVYSVLTK